MSRRSPKKKRGEYEFTGLEGIKDRPGYGERGKVNRKDDGWGGLKNVPTKSGFNWNGVLCGGEEKGHEMWLGKRKRKPERSPGKLQ